MMLARHEVSREQKASPLIVRRPMDVSRTVEMIVHECVRHLRLNEPAIIDHRNPEAVHQARVAMRRLRAAYSFFRPAIRRRSLRPRRKSIQDFSRPFGRARDLDVFLDHHGKDLASADRKKIGDAREAAYDRIIEALTSRETPEMLLDLVEWSEAVEWRKSRADDLIGDYAAKRFDAVWRKVKRKASKLPDIDGKQLHRLRISIKKLRYALEFMAALYSRKDIGKFVDTLEKMQDCLGHLHDDLRSRQLAREFALEFAVRARMAKRSRCLKDAKAHFKRLKRLGRVWAL